MIQKQIVQKIKFPYVFILKVLIVIGLIICEYYFENELAGLLKLNRVIDALYIFLIPSIFLSIIHFIVILLYNARHKQRIVRGNFVLGVNRLTAVLDSTFGIIALLIGFGINPKDFITSLTIFAMAIAVLFRDYITNMVSGLIIMFSDHLSVGDRVKIGDYKGRIVDITLANLVLQDEEDDIIMVPNNMMFTSTFTNLSAHQSSLFTVRFELPIKASLHLEELENILKSNLVNHPNLSQKTEDFNLKVVELGKDYVRIKLDLHAINNSNRLHRKLENEILKEVIKFERDLIKSF